MTACMLAGLIAAGCAGRTFDPSGPCTSDGRAPGAYPSLEALVPRELSGEAPTRVDSGRNCTPSALGTLVAHGVTEMRYAGSKWDNGDSSGVTIAVFEAPDLEADWVHEFFRVGAENARNTEDIEASKITLGDVPAYRVDALNGEAYQTVIDWQDGDRVRVVLVSNFIREIQTLARHEQVVADALAAAGAKPPETPE
jgi:hypothetical protein